MDFNEIIRQVNSFYSKYDETISSVDDFFDIIDTNAGEEADNELTKIVDLLQDFWTSHYQSEDNNELIVDEAFSSFSNRLLGKFENDTDIFNLCKEIQTYFRNYTAVDTKPIVHCEADEVISKLFDIVKNRQFSDKDLLFSIIKIIYELVTDDLLVRCGISKLYKWNYGTDAYSLLSAEQQLIILLNQSIMIDRLHGGQQLLKSYLRRLNKQLDGFESLDWFVYYVAGFLNFKIHNYRESKKYFEYVEKKGDALRVSDVKTQKRYFHAVLLIAYGYEYAGEFSRAIDKIVLPVDDLLTILKSTNVQNIRNIDTLLNILNNLIANARENTIFSNFFGGRTITAYISDDDDPDQRNIHIEILHALAHCINEYAIQNYSVQQEDCAILISFARSLMAFIAKEVKEYWTCYATIHGEYKDYDIALQELDKASRKISESEGKIKESLAAEIAFYQYYFGQIINKDIESVRKTFSRYCQKYSDDDAFCHLQIFEFRALLREHVSAMFDFLTQNNRRQNKIDNMPPINSIRQAYNMICQLHPSAHMNINIRAELRLMQRVYTIIDCLNNYLMHPSKYNTLMLENACMRFCNTKKEMGLSESTGYPKCNAKHSVLPERVHKTLFGEYGVVHCLNVTDSVFLLAPISGVVVYQYQTGTIDKLFDIESLLNVFCGANVAPLTYFDMKDTITTYRKVISEDKQVQISNVDMDEFAQKGVDDIYLWSSDVPLRLLQASKGGYFSRRLVDGSMFCETIETVEKNAKANSALCVNDLDYGDCKIYKVNLPWLEIVNENKSNNSFLLYRRIRDSKTEYLILSGENIAFEDKQCCEIHRLLDNVGVRQIIRKKDVGGQLKPIDSIDPEKIKAEIKDAYAKFRGVCDLLENKAKDIRDYKGSRKEEFELGIEKLKKQRKETMDVIKSNLETLFKLLTKDLYLEFVETEIETKDYVLFNISI